MATRITRPKAPYLPPKNNRLISVGQRNLEALQHNNRQNVINAIQSTGYPITLYNTLRTGLKCSCTYVQQPPNEILDSEGKLTEQDMTALLTPGSGLVDYGSDTHSSQNLQSNLPVKRITLNDTSQPVLNPRETLVQTQFDERAQFDRMLDDWGEEDLDPSFSDEITTERFFANQGRACAVCFGTGYVGGYELMHGTRILLTPMMEHEKADGMTIDRTASPNCFNSYSDGWVRWQVLLPRGTEYALYPRVFNNTTPIPYSEWKLVDSAGTELDPAHIKEMATGKYVYVELRFKELTFTHVELILSNRPPDQPLKADSPEIQTLTDVTRMDAKSPVTWILGGTYNISKRSVVIDHLPRLSRHWRVNDIQERRDNLSFIYEQTLTSRLVDLYELTQLLRPVRFERSPLD